MDYQEVDGQPTANGLFVRSVDAISGEVTDMDVKDGHHRVKVEFPHDTRDTYNTTFDPDCFRDSFAERKPVMCWQHDLRDPIGTAEDAQVTRRHNELIGRFSKFDEDRGLIPVPNAYRAYSQLRDGELKDFSFGFKDPVYEPHRSMRGVRNIKWAVMKEFSPVTIGSIPGAGASGVREDQVMTQQSIQDILALRDGGMISDEDAQEAIRAMMDPELAQKVRIISPAKTVTGEVRPDGTVAEPADATRDEDDLPEVLNAAAIMAVLPESYQRTIYENGARVFLVVGDEEWGPVSQVRALDDGMLTMAAQVDAACRAGLEWLGEVKLDDAPEELRQAAALFQAAGTAAEAMLDIGDPDGTFRSAAEDMASQPVKCEECDGTGKVDTDANGDGGKVCPRCEGSGVEAEQRADMECNVCHGSGKDPVTKEDCPHCHGTGKVSDYKPSTTRAYWQDETYLRFVSADDRKKMADEGVAMSNGDFPIPDKGHLSSALGHWRDYQGDKKAAKAHIQKRAKALGVELAKDDFQNRADMPDGMKECAKCDGDGKLPAPSDGGHRLTCPDCHGKGMMARAEPDDDDDSEDDMADESGDGKPSGKGAAASEDTDEDDDGDGDPKRTEDPIEAKRQSTLARLDRRVGV